MTDESLPAARAFDTPSRTPAQRRIMAAALEDPLRAAEVEKNRPYARKLLLDSIIDMTVQRRR